MGLHDHESSAYVDPPETAGLPMPQLTDAVVDRGMGDHIEVVLARGPENMEKYSQVGGPSSTFQSSTADHRIQYVFVSSIFYNASLGFIKCSVLALYARLGDRQLRRLAFVVMAICAASAGANVLVCSTLR